MDIKNTIKNITGSKKKIIIVSAIFLCMVLALIITLVVSSTRSKNNTMVGNDNISEENNLSDSDNGTNYPGKKLDSNTTDKDNSSTDKNSSHENTTNKNDPKDTKDVNKIEDLNNNKKIKLAIKNTNLGDPKDGEITQDKAISLLKKFIVPDICEITGVNTVQIKITKRDKVKDEECYFIDLNLIRKDKVSNYGKFAVATNGKDIYEEDSKTKQYVIYTKKE